MVMGMAIVMAMVRFGVRLGGASVKVLVDVVTPTNTLSMITHAPSNPSLPTLAGWAVRRGAAAATTTDIDDAATTGALRGL